MLYRLLTILIGILFISLGVAGFIAVFNYQTHLFSFFEIAKMNSFLYVMVGVLAIMAATQFKFIRIYFKTFGILYCLLAIAGFWRDGNLVIMHVNIPDNCFHLVVGCIFLYLGFFKKAARITY